MVGRQARRTRALGGWEEERKVVVSTAAGQNLENANQKRDLQGSRAADGADMPSCQDSARGERGMRDGKQVRER